MTCRFLTLLILGMGLCSLPAFADVADGKPTPMVKVPAGSFLRGSPDHAGRADERPRRTIYLDAFLIDTYEVTNAQYLDFISATGHQEPMNVYGDGSLFQVTGNNPPRRAT